MRFLARHPIHELIPTARLDPGFVDTPGGRKTMRLRERPSSRSVDAQIHALLVQGCNLVSWDEALASLAMDHYSVEDVFRGRGDNVIDRAHLLAI